MKFGMVLVAFLIGVSLEAAPMKKLTWETKESVSKILHSAKLAPYLNCSVRVRDLRQERRFASGSKWVEMLEVDYRSEGEFSAPMKAYFPVGTPVRIRTINSEFGGVVEEITLEARDDQNKTLIFRHNGRGQIVWIEMHDQLRLNPCRLKK